MNVAITFKMDTSAFRVDSEVPYAFATRLVLQSVANRISFGEKDGLIKDPDGNNVGMFVISAV